MQPMREPRDQLRRTGSVASPERRHVPAHPYRVERTVDGLRQHLRPVRPRLDVALIALDDDGAPTILGQQIELVLKTLAPVRKRLNQVAHGFAL